AVEHGDKHTVFAQPLHPYTRALMSATPAIRPEQRRIKIKLSGDLPSPLNPPAGCSFHTRCPFAAEQCKQEVPRLRLLAGRLVACHRVEEINS
ncbi:MAG: hypothetical protein RL341_1593, partial [Pseudomonadota bacterium]